LKIVRILPLNQCLDSPISGEMLGIILNRYCYDISDDEHCHLTPGPKKCASDSIAMVDNANLENLFSCLDGSLA
jgi:hypothetical protein